ncbi:MAG: TolB-like 6-bladed beta-propeller domain-containing protein [Tannerella sp.]|jgi:hypothetical protein|nr:TolB-like 6-bladed beta-propeller domain-containing protein [Tannerella sp.]
MKNLCICCLFYFAVAGCSFSSRKQERNAETLTVSAPAKEDVKVLEPLESGEVFYKNKDPFGEIIPLTGKHLDNDTVIFKVSEAEMLVRGNRLIVKNRVEEHVLMHFSLPDMRFAGFSGRIGRGPGEFSFPSLVPSRDTTVLAYLFETANQKLYRLEKSGELALSPFEFSKAHRRMGSDKYLVNVAPDDFVYVESSSTGKTIFRAVKSGDSTLTREVFNLSLNPGMKSWTAYIGDFAVNPGRDRMAYAYKYFKIIKFMDMEAQAVRTVNFERNTFDENSPYRMNGLDANVTHYWGVCAGEDYVYFLYSGRTPMEVGRDNGRNRCYIFVEQYDWNGNPVRKYKLDKWGYFTVDEKNKRIYLLSTNDDDPFFAFDME